MQKNELIVNQLKFDFAKVIKTYINKDDFQRTKMRLSATLIENKIVCLININEVNSKYVFDFDKAKLEEISRDLRNSLRISSAKNFISHRNLEKNGERLAVYFLPLVKRLIDFSGNLFFLVDSDLLFIPWELIFDGQHFWGEKFNIGRNIPLANKIFQTSNNSKTSTKALIIFSNPTQDLNYGFEEAKSLLKFFDSKDFIEVTLKINPKVIEIKNILNDYDIIHYIGHSQIINKNKISYSAWKFKDGFLSEQDILECGGIKNTPFLVFSNSCAAVTPSGQLSEKLPLSFLKSGSKIFIGTIWDIPDNIANEVALLFYNSLFSGFSVGESFEKIKYNDKNNNYKYLYVLYADPDAVFISDNFDLNNRKFSYSLQKEELKNKYFVNGFLSFLKYLSLGLLWIIVMATSLLIYDRFKSDNFTVLLPKNLSKQNETLNVIGFSGVKGNISDLLKNPIEVCMIKSLSSINGIKLIDLRYKNNVNSDVSIIVSGSVFTYKNGISVVWIVKNTRSSAILHIDEMHNIENDNTSFCSKFAEWFLQKTGNSRNID